MKPKERIPDAIYERGYVYTFHFHLIWVTKYRNPAFTTPELVQEMKDILLRIAQLNDVTVEELEVMPEHVHMLISFKPKYTPTNIVKALKGGSARLFLKKHPEIKHDKFWGRSYLVTQLLYEHTWQHEQGSSRKIHPESVFQVTTVAAIPLLTEVRRFLAAF